MNDDSRAELKATIAQYERDQAELLDDARSAIVQTRNFDAIEAIDRARKLIEGLPEGFSHPPTRDEQTVAQYRRNHAKILDGVRTAIVQGHDADALDDIDRARELIDERGQ